MSSVWSSNRSTGGRDGNGVVEVGVGKVQVVQSDARPGVPELGAGLLQGPNEDQDPQGSSNK